MGFAGDEADGGDGGRRRWRACRALAGEFDALADAPESGEVVSVLREARGGEVLSESSPDYVGAEGGVRRNSSSLGAERGSGMGEMEKKMLAFK